MADSPKQPADAHHPSLRQLLAGRYDALLRKLTRRLGSKERADDALHDAWLRLEREPDLSAIRDPFAYVVRVATNEAISVQRREARRAALLNKGGEIVDRDPVDAMSDIADDAPDPEQVVLDKSEWDAMQRAIETLSERRRDILIATMGEGVSFAELAARHGVTVRWVQIELKAALAYCAEKIGRK
jgi:RNA polymerase sigma factor (sigma-70 family)